MAVPPAVDVRPAVSPQTEPVSEPAGPTPSRSLRLSMLVALLVLLLAATAAVVHLASTRPVPALGIGGDQAALQSERESVMAQAEQFMLRINTYGPDLLEGVLVRGGIPAAGKQRAGRHGPSFRIDHDLNDTIRQQFGVRPRTQRWRGQKRAPGERPFDSQA